MILRISRTLGPGIPVSLQMIPAKWLKIIPDNIDFSYLQDKEPGPNTALPDI